MSEWQDIETAPKGFTPNLVFVPGSRHAGFQEEFDVISIVYWKRDAFVFQDDDHMICDGATHWQPLPSPPEPQQ